MKLYRLIIILTTYTLSHSMYAQSYTWNGAIDSDWANANNWTPATGPPGLGDTAIINIGAPAVELDGNRTIHRLEMNTGTLHLKGFTLSVDSTVDVDGGVIDDGTFAAGKLFGDSLRTVDLQNIVSNSEIEIWSELWGAVEDDTLNGRVTYVHFGGTNQEFLGRTEYNNVVTFRTINNRFRPDQDGSVHNGDTLYLLNHSPSGTNENIYFSRDDTTIINAHVSLEINANGNIRFGSNGSTVGHVRIQPTKTITCNSCTGGSIYFDYIEQLGGTSQSITATDTCSIRFNQSSIWTGDVIVTAPNIYMQNGSFSGDVTINKNGSDDNNTSTGNNIVGGNLTINNSSTRTMYFGAGTADTIQGNVIVNNSNTGSVFLGNDGLNHLITGTCAFTNTSTGDIVVGGNSTASMRINGDITMVNTGNGDVRYGNNGSYTTFGTGVDLFIGGGGFTNGRLRFHNCSQADARNQTIVLTGTAIFETDSSVWDGIMTITSPQLLIDSTTFNSNAILEKNGATTNNSEGGNIFNGNTFITHSGTDDFRMANVSPDDYNGILNITNTSTGVINIGYNSTDTTTIDGNIVLTSTGSSQGIRFGESTSAIRFGSGNTISFGGSGFTRGTLRFRHFRQAGTTGQNFTLTGLATVDFDQSRWEADLTAASPRLRCDSSVFVGITDLNKTGSSADDMEGANTFMNNTTLTASGTGRWRFSNVGADTFLGDLDIINTGSNHIDIGYNGDTTTVAGTLTLTSSGSSTGIRFGENNGKFKLLSGQVVNIGAGGFSTGTLRFDHTYQEGNSAQTITVSGTAFFDIRESIWDAQVEFTAPDLETRETTYNGNTTLRKIGTAASDCYGQNIFNGNTTIINNGSERFRFSNTVADDFNGTLSLTSAGSHLIQIGYNGDTTTIAGNIDLSSSGSSTGIRFGENNGEVKFENGVVLSVGAGGFSTGTLRIESTRQEDAIDQNLTLTGTALFDIQRSHWEGNLTYTSPRLLTRETVYNGNVIFEKTSSTNDDSYGGNMFNATSTFTHSGSNRFRLAETEPDTMATTSNFINNGSGQLQAAFCENNLFSGPVNITNNASSTIDFVGSDPASAIFNGDITIVNSALSSSNIEFGNAANNLFTFNANVDATNNSTGQIIFGNANGANGIINGNVVMENTNGGTFRFGSTAGSSDTLKSGHTLSIGAGGFASGTLFLFNFIQESATAQALALTGTARIDIRTSSWDGDLVFSSPRFLTQTTTYNGTTDFTKNGATNDDCVGGNVFNALSTISHLGSARWRWAETNPDTFSTVTFIHNTAGGADFDIASSPGNLITGNLIINKIGASETHFGFTNNASVTVNGTADFNNTATSSGNLEVSNGNTSAVNLNGTTTVSNLSSNNLTFSTAVNSTTVIDANVILENNNSGSIIFGNIGNSGSDTLKTGNSISIGANGFDSGNLNFRNFIQEGNSVHSLTLTGTTTFMEQRQSSWDGDVTFICPRFTTRETTYSGTTHLEKTSTGNNHSYGNNVFNGVTSIIQNGTGRLRFASTIGDDYNNDVTYIHSNTGAFQMAYQDTNYYAGNITTNSTGVLTLGENNGVIAMDNTGAQGINVIGTTTLDMEHLDISRGTGTVTLNSGQLRLKLGTSIMTFGDRYFDLSGNRFLMTNQSGSAITYNNGYFISEATDNSSQVLWVINNNTDLHTFPFGNIAGDTLPFEFTRNTGNVGNVTVSTYGTPVNNTPLPTSPDNVTNINGASGITDNSLNMNDRYWQIDISGAGNADIAIPYTASEIAPTNTIDEADLVAQRWEGTQWSLVPVGTVNIARKKVEVAGVTTFSPWVLVDSDDPLPVEIIDFKAEKTNEGNLVSWITSVEINNDYFILQSSGNGSDFVDIAQINGNGNSSNLNYYDYIDLAATNSLTYYRLIQVDFDGSTNISEVIKVNNIQVFDFKLFPNPTHTEKVNIYISKSDYVNHITLYDAVGIIVLTRDLNDGQHEIDLNGLSSGSYTIQVLNGSNLMTKKLIIQ